MSRRSRLTVTILASVLLHAVLFAALARGRSDVAPLRPGASDVIELEVFETRAGPVGSPDSRPSEPPPARTSTPPPRRSQRPRSPAQVAQGTEAPAAPEIAKPRTEDGSQAASESARPMREDAPRASPPLALLPRNMPGGVAVEEPPSRGRTVRNLPGEEPDPEAVKAYEAEEAKARVEGWAADAVAAARAGGATPPYFRQLQNAFTEQLVNPPPVDMGVVQSRMKRQGGETLQRFGKTGSPVVAPEKRDHRLEQRNRLQAAVEAGRAANMYMVDVTAPVLALAAIVEVWQEPDGKLRELKVLESSGDAAFDAWAVSRLRNALAKKGASPDAGVGDDGIRSRWRLEEYFGNPRVQIHLIGVY